MNHRNKFKVVKISYLSFLFMPIIPLSIIFRQQAFFGTILFWGIPIFLGIFFFNFYLDSLKKYDLLEKELDIVFKEQQAGSIRGSSFMGNLLERVISEKSSLTGNVLLIGGSIGWQCSGLSILGYGFSTLFLTVGIMFLFPWWRNSSNFKKYLTYKIFVWKFEDEEFEEMIGKELFDKINSLNLTLEKYNNHFLVIPVTQENTMPYKPKAILYFLKVVMPLIESEVSYKEALSKKKIRKQQKSIEATLKILGDLKTIT